MKSEMKINVRLFNVKIRDERTKEEKYDSIILEKNRLQAGELVGINNEELIHRLYNHQGYRVLKIDKPIKKQVIIDLRTIIG